MQEFNRLLDDRDPRLVEEMGKWRELEWGRPIITTDPLTSKDLHVGHILPGDEKGVYLILMADGFLMIVRPILSLDPNSTSRVVFKTTFEDGVGEYRSFGSLYEVKNSFINAGSSLYEIVARSDRRDDHRRLQEAWEMAPFIAEANKSEGEAAQQSMADWIKEDLDNKRAQRRTPNDSPGQE